MITGLSIDVAGDNGVVALLLTVALWIAELPVAVIPMVVPEQIVQYVR